MFVIVYNVCLFCRRAAHEWVFQLCRDRLSIVQLIEKSTARANYSFLVSDLKQYANNFIIPLSAHDYGRASLTPVFDLLLFCHLANIPAAIVILCENSTLYVIDDISVEFNEFCRRQKASFNFSPKLLRSNTPINGRFFSLFLATDMFTVLNEEKFLASGITSFHAMQEGAKVGFFFVICQIVIAWV
jgi:hypothetical protein